MGEENTRSCVVTRILAASLVTLAGAEACALRCALGHSAAVADNVKVGAAVVASSVLRSLLVCMELLADAGGRWPARRQVRKRHTRH
jgi:hypothetical protein